MIRTDCDPLLAAYEAATAKERLEWQTLHDDTEDAGKRMVAYARWRRAAESVKLLADRLLASADRVQSPPSRLHR